MKKLGDEMTPSELAAALGVRPGLLCYYAKKLGFMVAARTSAQHQKLVEAVQARTDGNGKKKPKKAPEPKPTAPPAAELAPQAVVEDLELRVLRAFYPDGISPDQYPRALRVLCLASEVEP